MKIKNEKIRVNITVDAYLLEKAKTKLDLFGGKLSTLFNAYLRDFVESMDKEPYLSRKEVDAKMKEIEKRIEKIEKGSNQFAGIKSFK